MKFSNFSYQKARYNSFVDAYFLVETLQIYARINLRYVTSMEEGHTICFYEELFQPYLYDLVQVEEAVVRKEENLIALFISTKYVWLQF